MSAARVTAGRAARKRTPLDRHGVFQPPADRPDPVDIVLAQEKDRLPELLDLRHKRMRASPLAFYRGAAAVMAADLVTQPDSGLVTQLCGDAHLYGLVTARAHACFNAGRWCATSVTAAS